MAKVVNTKDKDLKRDIPKDTPNNDPKEDTPILQVGTGTPYLAIFDDSRSPILNQVTGLPLGIYVDQFSYKYDEKEHNSAQITFEVEDPDIVDQESLQKGQIIYLQWGYIYADGTSSCNEPVGIKIENFDASFDENGVNCLIKGRDCTSTLRKLPSIPCGNSEASSMIRALDIGFGIDQGVIIVKYE